MDTAATVSRVQIQADISGFRDEFATALHVTGAHLMLQGFYEWLKARGDLPGSAADVVDLFIKEKCGLQDGASARDT